jgi:uncharacterized protein (TIGR02145 family)
MKIKLITNLSAAIITSIVLGSCTNSKSVGDVSSTEVKIGEQIWMTENLNVDKFRNGEPIPEVKTEEEWEKYGNEGKPAWCYYNNDPSNGKKYGKLYNWFAVTDPRGISPKGWRVPADEDFMELMMQLGGQDVAGTKMKDTKGWAENGNGDNESGFSGLPGGVRTLLVFFDRGSVGWWWSTSKTDSTQARGISLVSGEKRMKSIVHYKTVGLSVRCIKN